MGGGNLSVRTSHSAPLQTDQSVEIETTSVSQPQDQEIAPIQSEPAQKKIETNKQNGVQKRIEQNIAGSIKQKELNEQLKTDTLQSQPVMAKDPLSSERKRARELREGVDAQRAKIKILEEQLEKTPDSLKPALKSLIDKEKTNLKKAEEDALVRNMLDGLEKKSEKSPMEALGR